MEQAVGTYRAQTVTGRLVGIGALAGLAGGVGMAMWQMIYSAVQGEGFWSPVNVCMASFIYRSQGQMMIDEAMAHPGMMSMNGPVQASHILVGGMAHMMFSAVVGIAFAIVLALLARTALAGLLRSYLGYIAAAMAGGAITYAVMMSLVIPWANPVMQEFTPRGPFFIGHLAFGMIFGLVAFPLLRRRSEAA